MASNESSLLAISDLFQAADKDRNGNLSRDEIAGIMRQIKKGGLPTDAEVNMCMSMMDRDSDGVITKEEFTSAMAKWLVGTPYNPCTCNPFPFSADTNLQGLSSASTADIASPSGKNRRRGVSDLAKFFKQFDTVSDFGAQQELILQRERPEIDHSVLLHEFPVVPKERKLEIHRGISAIVAAGKTCLLAELHSTDWNVVLGAVHKVRDLLSIVEVFHDPDERFELSSLIIRIFTGVTEVEDPPTVITSNGKPVTSVIRRIVNLLSPMVPDHLKPVMFPSCLAALHSYMIGPIAESAGIPQGGSVWNPDLMLTKQVVEHEQLPVILLRLLDDNFAVSDSNQEMLRAVVRCVSVFAQRHSTCLEGMLRLGFRFKIVALLQQPAIELPLMRSGLAALAVLCGHSHASTAALPAAVALTTKELFDILYSQHVILATIMQTPFNSIDCIVVVNVFTVLRYMLPLCSPNDHLFQAILKQLLHFLCATWDLNQEMPRHVVVTLNVCMEEVLLVSPLLNRQIWLTPGFSEAMLNQLIQSGSRSDGALSQLACSNLSVINTLLTEGSLSDVLMRPANVEFMQRCASLAAAPEVSWYAMKFLTGCMQRRELFTAVTTSGAVDRLFISLLKFKTHSSAVSALLGSGPVFNITGALAIIKLLSDFLEVDPAGRSVLFTADHVDTIGQLHGIICAAMLDSQLGLSDELVNLTTGLASLMEAIRDSHVAARSTLASYISDMVTTLLGSWAEKLNAAFSAHSYVVTTGTMDVDSGSRYMYANAAPSDIMIDVALIPSWSATLSERIQIPVTCTLLMLENGLASKYGTNVSLFKDQKMLNGQHIPIADQTDLESMYRAFVDGRGLHPVVLCVMPAVNAMFTNEQVRLSLQKGALYSAVGLVPKEVTLRELRNELRATGITVNSALMSDFYDYFNSRNVAEVTVAQFIECMTSSKMKFSESSARAIFNAFDADRNNLLSLKELGLGFAKMTDGSIDDKLLLMFQAYDSDRNNYLDVNELTHMIHVASGASLVDANQYATSVIQHVDKNADAKLDFMEFRDAAYKQMIPVALLWSEGNLDFIAGGGHHNNYQEYDNQHKRKGDQKFNKGGQNSPRRNRSGSRTSETSPGHHNHGRNNDRSNSSPRRAHSSGAPHHGGKNWGTPSSPRQGNQSPRHEQGRSQSFSYNNNRPPPATISKPTKFKPVSPSHRGSNPFARR